MGARSKKGGRPLLEPRPIFVQYIAVRRCYYNPSFANFGNLPAPIMSDVTHRWTSRHRGKALPGFKVSLPPLKRKS